AVRIAPLTERFFHEAGIASGQRVLDLGSGLGDVAMLAARIVGPSGEVVGLERDSRSIARAKARAAGAGLRNVSFIESDVGNIPEGKPFDAAVGRFILEFVSDPVAVVRNVSDAVCPGGAIAFQEVSWAHFLLACAGLPLWSASAAVAREILTRTGAHVEIGVALHRIFQEAGLPEPVMNLEIPLGSHPNDVGFIYEFLRSLRPQSQKHGVSFEDLGDFDSLSVRLQSEVRASKTFVPVIAALVSAWCRKPASDREDNA
ncbi:MAG TPA: methyltransferase domain-containing protein, partial [Chloroflexota bacterium]